MKKLLALFSIILLINQADAQTNYYLSPVALDGMVSVSLPKRLIKFDTLGQKTISANGTYGSMLVIRTANAATGSIKNESGLDEVFTQYIKSLQKSLPGSSVINAHDTMIGKLKAQDFVLQIDTGSGIQSRHIALVYTQNTTYTFEYLYDDYRKELAIGEDKAFFSSIRVSDEMTAASQYITVSPGFFTPLIEIMLAAIVPAIIGGGAFILLRRRTEYI